MTVKELEAKYPTKEFSIFLLSRGYTIKKNDTCPDMSTKMVRDKTAQIIQKSWWTLGIIYGCEDWEANDEETIKKMIKDLQEALKYMQENP